MCSFSTFWISIIFIQLINIILNLLFKEGWFYILFFPRKLSPGRMFLLPLVKCIQTFFPFKYSWRVSFRHSNWIIVYHIVPSTIIALQSALKESSLVKWLPHHLMIFFNCFLLFLYLLVKFPWFIGHFLLITSYVLLLNFIILWIWRLSC